MWVNVQKTEQFGMPLGVAKIVSKTYLIYWLC